MTQEFKYTSIILGKKDVGEVDRLYFFYTEERGLVKVIGKGVRKSNAKLAGNLETGNLAEVLVVQGKGKGKIVGVIPRDNFLEIKNNPELALQIFEVFGKFMRLIQEEEKDEKLFEVLLDLLESINKKDLRSEKSRLFFLSFYFKFLDTLGYKIEVKRCVRCQSKLLPENNFFSVTDGGVVCSACSSGISRKIKIDSGSIKILRIFLENKISSLDKVVVSSGDLRTLENIRKIFLAWIMD